MRTSRQLITTIVLALAAVAALAADPPPDDAWRETIARATAERKPILTYLRPEGCLVAETGQDSCSSFLKAIGHPAIQRRLNGVVFLTRDLVREPSPEPTAAAAEPARLPPPEMTVHSPSGELLVRWVGPLAVDDFAKILALIDGATSDIVAADREALAGHANLALRHRIVAILALGSGDAGRALLRGLSGSQLLEDRELASIWTDALDAVLEGKPRSASLLEALAERGSTPSVRFEALLSLGKLRLAEGHFDEAVKLCTRAAGLAPTRSLAAIARTVAQRASDRSSPFVGLGEYDSLVVGRRTVRPRKLDPKTATVRLTLSGRMVAKLTAPFVTGVNFGPTPLRQVLEFVALDKRGRELQRGSTTVNDRSDAFSIQITSPSATWVSGAVDVTADVRVPRGRTIEAVRFEWNGRTIARPTAPPWESRLTIGEAEEGILEASVRLDDGSIAEDVRLLNQTSFTMASRVHLLEVPVNTDGPPPAAKDLTVRENGTPRSVERVVTAGDAPLRVALLLDTSASMRNHLLDLKESALQFVEKNIGADDRAMLLAFGGTRTTVWPTSDAPLLTRAILNLEPIGGTALYDAIVGSLVNMQPSGCRRAIVIFTDCIDNASVFSISEVEDVARRTGVPIYLIRFRADPMAAWPVERYESERNLMRLSRESGGKSFLLESLSGLGAIWADIAADLERQSLVIFRTQPRADGWSDLEIKAGGRKLRAPKAAWVAPDGE